MFDGVCAEPRQRCVCAWCCKPVMDGEAARFVMHEDCAKKKKEYDVLMDMLGDLVDCPGEDFQMDDWEIDFVESLCARHSKDGNMWRPTEKQAAKLREIHAKMVESGA